MSTSIRLAKAFSRLGIALSYSGGVYQLSTPQASARVLLPPSLSLEEKAVQQLLAFASVRTPDGTGQVCSACATPDFHPGNLAPVGAIVATPGDFVIPASIGTDINEETWMFRPASELRNEMERERLRKVKVIHSRRFVRVCIRVSHFRGSDIADCCCL